jgi:hypothetical protein
MALSSDEIIKREIIDVVGTTSKKLELRIFPQSSNEDQKLVENGGLTFSHNGVSYGSCDAAWVDKDGSPVIALEGTDALNRKSSGNAQYQRFHHALGAVKNGLLGIYYLKRGVDKIQEDLYGMAYFATKKENGTYLIIDDLVEVKELVEKYGTSDYDDLISFHVTRMKKVFNKKFNEKYNRDWNVFAKSRSTIIKEKVVIKYAGRMKRNFTDGSQRAGHIAVGEMYLTKYYFYDHNFKYLFLKMTAEERDYLDIHKADDKEWYLLRHEENVEIMTMDDIHNLPKSVKLKLLSIKDEPLKGDALRIYNECVQVIDHGLRSGSLFVL